MPDNYGSIKVQASAAFAGPGNIALPTPPFTDKITLYINITAITGTTPTMDMVLEQYDPGSDTWVQVGANIMTARNTTGMVAATFSTDALRGRLRVRWTQGGTTPNFTFSIGMIVARAR